MQSKTFLISATLKGLLFFNIILFCIPSKSGLEEGMIAYRIKDYATAFSELLPLAQKGDPYAQLQVGNMYANGYGVAVNQKLAVRWTRLAAEQDLAAAQYNLGLMYSYGLGVPANPSRAFFWWRKSADQGHASAQKAINKLCSTKGEVCVEPSEFEPLE